MVCVNSVSVSHGSLCLEVGQYGYPSASVSPSNASCKDVRWSSSNSSVASVNQTSGYVYARAEGTAIITATATDGSGKSDSLTVTVSEPEPDVVCVSSVQVSPEILILVVGSSASVSASVYPPFATDTSVTWSSENSSVARVDSSGRITAVGQGQTKIYATADDGSGKRDYVCVKVTYCGGDNYRDVTQHTMVLQGNYYVCTTCGYRVKTPEFQDVEILAMEDYLKVVALEHFISQLLILISKNFSVSN